jgi:hypothetical protein
MLKRIARVLDASDRVLGRLVFRLFGLVLGALTLATFSMLRTVLTDEGLGGLERIAAVALALVAMLLCGAGTWYCFGRGRRLSDIEF